ncbi:MAG: hypothetical protein GYA21_18610, partial [Myxococcales bacterium]|nr:hypothetical protein [Myxococcales bacterium]
MPNEEKPSASGSASAPLHEKEARVRGQRSLFINVLLMFLVSIVVFAVASYFFLVPKIAMQDLRMLQLQQRLNMLEEDLADLAADQEVDLPPPLEDRAAEPPAPAPGAPPAAAA